jgi:hypothetical protein
MLLREAIDPGATGPNHVLRTDLFELLRQEGLVWGGMLGGAMGGGVAMLVPRAAPELIEQRLSALAAASPVFASMQTIRFSVNTNGIQLE